jgi:hypothetical protein
MQRMIDVERGGVDSIFNMNMAQFIGFVRRNLLLLLFWMFDHGLTQLSFSDFPLRLFA